jgi:peroxiredoxin Q/BCP
MIQTGQSAPPFTLLDHTGSPLSLADLRGQWVVLYFYPRDDTPGCTVEACDFTSGLGGFQGLGAAVIGCSPDSPESHQRFIDKYRLGVQLLSDPDKAVMREYGAYGKKMNQGLEVEGVIRSTVLIAPDGTIAQHWPSVKADGHAEAVRAALVALQAGRTVAGSAPATAKTTKTTKTTKAKTAAKPKSAARPGKAAPRKAALTKPAPRKAAAMPKTAAVRKTGTAARKPARTAGRAGAKRRK